MPDKLREKLDDHIVIFDGAIGTELYRRDFFINASYEGLCLSSPQVVSEIHRNYIDAGAEVITTNSYGANRNKLARHGLGEKVIEINTAAVALAKAEVQDDTIIAGSVGPVGDSAYGAALTDEQIVQILGEQMQALEQAGVDFILCETLATFKDAENAYKAVCQYTSIPFMFSFTVDRELETPQGEPLAHLLKIFGEDNRKPTAIGLNCCVGAEGMLAALEKLIAISHYPVIVQPNAGMPKNVDNRMIYMCSPEYLTTYAVRYINLGARGVGGCCGTGPEHIRDIARSIKPLAKIHVSRKINTIESAEPLLLPVAQDKKSRFAAKLHRGEWITTVEITPPRGFDLSSTIEKAIICREAGVDAINIPDGPRASSRISPIITAIEIQEKAGIEAILHCCCRDKNLIGMQADLLGCACKNINNILFITGDPPKLGDYPFASAVFDVDAIGILRVASRLNLGIDIGGKSIGSAPTAICAGAGADPNSIDMRRELARVREKVEAGAEYIITQPVFSTEPLLRFIEEISDLQIPIIAGIWPLASFRNAEFLKHEVPGVVIPDEIMERMARVENKDDQRKTGIDIAREAVSKLRSAVQGIQVSAPFGNVNSAIAVLKD
ncbi:MAG: bifunctional homocysteine S-methyltransferase/methylenetetrahydrofolate reductase [Victivallaceae bacterium]